MTEPAEIQTPPPANPASTPVAAPVAPEPPKIDPELEAKLKRLADLEAREAEAEKAKLTEAERIKAERTELNRERFQLELQKAGLTEEAAALFPQAPEDSKKRAALVATVAKAWKAQVDAAAKPAPAQGAAPVSPMLPTQPSNQSKAEKVADTYRDILKSMRKPRGA